MSQKIRFYICVTFMMLFLIQGSAWTEPFGASYFTGHGPINLESLSISQSIHPNYKLGTGDELLIKLRGYQNEDFRSTVSVQGTISIPRVSPINVLGRTIFEAQEIVTENILSVYKNISVEVDIATLRRFNIFVTGEARYPGVYTITGNQSVLDALVLSGGPNQNGSFRKIMINRVGSGFGEQDGSRARESVQIDLYDFFINAEHHYDFYMEAGDVVWIPPVGPSVEIIGSVRRPAAYEFITEINVSMLIDLAGGFTAGAYYSKIVIQRKSNNGLTQEIYIDFNKPEGANFTLQDGDRVHVLDPNRMVMEVARFSSIDNIIPASSAIVFNVTDSVYQENFLPTATVLGEVGRPGIYNFAPGEKLHSFLMKAGGLMSTAFTPRAELLRTNEEGQVTHNIFPLRDAIANRESGNNFEIQDKDVIHIITSTSMAAAWRAKITGEVRFPGIYPVVTGSRIYDLIVKAGGLTDLAFTTTAELTRYREGKVSEILKVDIALINKDPSQKSNLLLENFDQLHIHQKPLDLSSIVIDVGGQVQVPGLYTLQKDSRLSDALQAAGGIRPEGSKDGVILVRQSLLDEEAALLKETEEAQERELLRMQSSIIDGAVTNDEKQLQLRSLEIRKRIITLLGKRRILGRLLFDPNQEDPVLKDGDIITIPSVAESVLIVGAVYGSGSITYQKGYTLDTYLNRMGGLTPYADEGQIYIIKPNGFIDRKTMNMSPIVPGDIIVVPPKIQDVLPIGFSG